MRLTIPTLAALALAGCSQGEPAPADPASPTLGRAATTPATADIAAVPDAFQGIWDSEKGSCDPASDLRVEIAERGITFYEAHGAVTAVAVESPNAVVVELAMQGEGETWTMRRRFTLSNGGGTLTAEAVDGDRFEPMPLKRCA